MSNNNKKEEIIEKESEVRDSKSNSKSRGRGNKGRNRSNKSNNRRERYNEANLDARGRNNKPGYYFLDKHLAEQATQLSFQNVLGYGSLAGYEVPTIMRIDMESCPGNTYDAPAFGAWDFKIYEGDTSSSLLPDDVSRGKSGVNLMAAKLYTLLSSFTGRTASYAPQDVAMMILAISAISEFSEALRRMFGLALTYNYWNRTLAYGILASMGLDVDDFMANISIYRMEFNVAMSRINQIPLLDNIAFIQKSREIYQDVYYDDQTSMSQIFYYMPYSWAYLDEVGDSEGSVLRHVSWRYGSNEQPHKFSDFLDNLNYAITCVLESSTLNFVYADMLNMANKIKTPMWKFDYLAENYTVLPQYNANACLQLHNLTITGPIAGVVDDLSDTKPVKTQVTLRNGSTKIWITGGADVFCDADKNNVVFNPAFLPNAYFAKARKVFIDMPSDNPTLEDRIEALRFASVWSGALVKPGDIGQTGTYQYPVLMMLPDHFAVQMKIYSNISGNSTDSPISISGDVVYGDATNYSNILPVSQWEHAPLIKIINANATNNIFRMLTDLSYYTSVDYEYVKRLLNVTYVGLFEFRV